MWPMKSKRAPKETYVLKETWHFEKTIWTHRQDAIFSSWWCLVRFSLSDISPSLHHCTCFLQSWFTDFPDVKLPLNTWCDLKPLVKNTQKLNRAFGLIMAIPVGFFRNEVGLRVAHSHAGEDQPFLLATWSWLVNYFHFLSEMEPGKSLNYFLKQAAYFLLFFNTSSGLVWLTWVN